MIDSLSRTYIESVRRIVSLFIMNIIDDHQISIYKVFYY